MPINNFQIIGRHVMGLELVTLVIHVGVLPVLMHPLSRLYACASLSNVVKKCLMTSDSEILWSFGCPIYLIMLPSSSDPKLPCTPDFRTRSPSSCFLHISQSCRSSLSLSSHMSCSLSCLSLAIRHSSCLASSLICSAVCIPRVVSICCMLIASTIFNIASFLILSSSLRLSLLSTIYFINCVNLFP